MTTPIAGHVAPGFEGVRAAFEANFGPEADLGAAVTVVHRGDVVVDLVGGHTDTDRQTAYDDDHLQLVFSTTKGATAACANLLAQRGELDLDAPVADVWPEFAEGGKGSITTRHLLTHTAGLYDVDESLTLEEALAWEPAITALAAQTPLFEPDSQHGYHAVTFGYLVGEVVRRVSGVSLGSFFAREFADPLGLDFWIGLPEEHHGRVAPLISQDLPDDPNVRDVITSFMGPGTVLGRALAAPGGATEIDLASADSDHPYLRPEMYSAEMPAANGICNSTSLARFYASLVGEVDGVRLFEPSTVDAACRPLTSGPDSVLMGLDIQFSTGFMTPTGVIPLGTPGRSFGHYGFGGSVGFADADAELGFGYVMNRTILGLAGDPRTAGLIDAVYAALA